MCKLPVPPSVLLACFVLLLPMVALAGPLDMSFLDLREAGVTRQTSSYTCGPAAVATLMTSFFFVPTTEHAVLERALDAYLAEDDALAGISLYALSHSLDQFGIV